MLGLILALLTIAGGGILFASRNKPKEDFEKTVFKWVGVGAIVSGLVLLASTMVITVPAGHAKVATLFGKVQDDVYTEGMHVVNPLLEFTTFDLRNKTHKEDKVGIPAEDKLITQMDVSIQYRTNGAMIADILRNTGGTQQLVAVQLIPKLRSILREQGKGVEQSQDFFKESVQQRLQTSLQVGLSEYLAPKGLEVESVLIRNIMLPAVIRKSIEETKKREQEVLKQKAELDRFAMEQDQKIAQAKSELEAAKLDALKVRELADAEAYKINELNKTLAKSPNYIELKKVEQWNGVLPVYAGGENVPMIDLR